MIEVGDLVKDTSTGKIGIVVGQAYPSALRDYWFVHDARQNLHSPFKQH
jgi:sorbitol-specific phosphotransferase system component IIA